MLHEHEFKVYDTLIKQLYQSFTIEEIRPLIMNYISHLIPYDSAAFFTADPDTYCFSQPYSIELDMKLFDQYTSYYEDKDEYKKTVFANHSIPVVDRSSDYMNYKKWENNEHRTDFLLPQKIYHIACLQILNNNHLVGEILVGEISLHRSAKSPDFSDREMAILRLLQSHTSNALQNVSLLKYHSPLKAINHNDTNEKIGLCLLDRNGKVIGSNSFAQNILALPLVTGQTVYSYFKELGCHLSKEQKKRSVYGTPSEKGTLSLKDFSIHYNISILENQLLDFRTHFLIIINLENKPSNFNWQKHATVKLTKREIEIINLIGLGKTNKEIAQSLFISENTVKTHNKRIFSKFGISSRTELTYHLRDLSQTHSIYLE